MRKITWLLFIAVIAISCAVIEPPTGGPEDKTAPEIIEVIPAPDSTGISRTQRVNVIFSEKIDSESFRQRIIFYPELPFKKIEVNENRLEIEFKEILPETTISFYLKGGYKDNHNVKSEKSSIFYFSTVDSLEKGSISGRIYFKNKIIPGGTARLSSVKPDTFKYIYKKQELRTATALEDGEFNFKHLPTDSAGFRLWAFIDSDGDGVYSGSKEFYFLYPDTIYLTKQDYAARNLILNIIDPEEPGEVKGNIVNKTFLENFITVKLENIKREKAGYQSQADSSGVYEIKNVLPGDYILSAFIDMNADSLPGSYIDPADSNLTLQEPVFSLPDTIRVLPAEIKEIPVIELGNDEDE